MASTDKSSGYGRLVVGLAVAGGAAGVVAYYGYRRWQTGKPILGAFRKQTPTEPQEVQESQPACSEKENESNEDSKSQSEEKIPVQRLPDTSATGEEEARKIGDKPGPNEDQKISNQTPKQSTVSPEGSTGSDVSITETFEKVSLPSTSEKSKESDSGGMDTSLSSGTFEKLSLSQVNNEGSTDSPAKVETKNGPTKPVLERIATGNKTSSAGSGKEVSSPPIKTPPPTMPKPDRSEIAFLRNRFSEQATPQPKTPATSRLPVKQGSTGSTGTSSDVGSRMESSGGRRSSGEERTTAAVTKDSEDKTRTGSQETTARPTAPKETSGDSINTRKETLTKKKEAEEEEESSDEEDEEGSDSEVFSDDSVESQPGSAKARR